MKRQAASLLLIGLITSSAWAGEPYFPNLILGEDQEDHDFTAEWYSEHLKAAHEPSLFQRSKTDPVAEVYRFVCLPTFYRPIAVRVSRAGEVTTLRAVQLDGMGGYEPGKVAFNRTVKLTEDQWNWLQVHVEKARFWDMPTKKKLIDSVFGDGGVCDGDQWICEGVRKGTYHVVDRDNPDGDYEMLCLYILGLSGLDLEYPYFPEHVLSRDGRYTQILRTMKEPSFWKLSRATDNHIYRFLWVRPGARRVALEIELYGEVDDKYGPALHVLESHGSEPTVRKSVLLTQETWDGFLRQVEQVQFWALPAEPKGPPPADAPRLILEGVNKSGTYHVVDRAGADPGDLQKLVDHVTDLAGADLRKLLDEDAPKP